MDIVVRPLSLAFGGTRPHSAAMFLPDLTAEDLKAAWRNAWTSPQAAGCDCCTGCEKPPASLLIEQGERCGEPLDDPALLFSTLYDLWVANYAAFNGHILCGLAKKFLALAEKKGMTDPLMIGRRLMGVSLVATGNIAECRAHLDRAFDVDLR